LDTFGYYRNTTTQKDPMTNASANDLAIWDADADLWGGSYHGGESSIATAFKADGVSLSLSVDDFVVCENLVIEQSYTIDWSGDGGGTLNVRDTHTCLVGGYAYAWTATGSMNAAWIYTTLFGMSEDYTLVVDPEEFDITTLADEERHAMPYGNSVTLLAATGDQVRLDYSTYNYGTVREGGPTLRRTIGTYHKFYNSIVEDGLFAVENITAKLRVTLS